MGTTMFFVLMSMMPEYNRKIELGLLMAPVAYVNHTQSPVYQLFSPLESSLYVSCLIIYRKNATYKYFI